jgi:hypothetical protein
MFSDVASVRWTETAEMLNDESSLRSAAVLLLRSARCPRRTNESSPCVDSIRGSEGHMGTRERHPSIALREPQDSLPARIAAYTFLPEAGVDPRAKREGSPPK